MGYLADKRILVLVADAARARVFSPAAGTGSLSEIETLVNPSARLHGADLTSDREGRGHGSAGGGRHGVESSSGAKDHSSDNFAREVSARLGELATENGSAHIALIAAPEFLGRLRKTIPASAAAMVSAEISKDLTASDASEIEAAVLQQMRG